MSFHKITQHHHSAFLRASLKTSNCFHRTAVLQSLLGLLLQLLVLAATPVTCDRAADHHLRYRRQALENTTTPGHEGEPPTTVLQQQRYSDPGGGAPDLREAGGEVLPSPAPGVNHPVSDLSSSDDGGSAHSGIVIVLTLVCVTLLVIVLVGLAAVLRYWTLQRRKKTGRDALWTEGAHYSPANPRPPPRRHHSSRQTKNGSINRYTRHSLTSHITTELYRVVYPYRSTDPTHLKLEPGSVVEVVEKTKGWWRGFVGQAEGWFPENYVERVYEGSGITLEDYTETMGETLTRHLSGQQNNTNNTNNTVTPTREQLRQQGIDEVDFQAAGSRSSPQNPSLGDPGEEDHGSLSRENEEPLGRSSPHELEAAEEDPTSGDEFILERPIASSPENDLLESIFNDLEKAWSKSEVSTPINKDYCKVEQGKGSISPIPLGASLEEGTSEQNNALGVAHNGQNNPEGIYEFNKYMRFQLEAEQEADLLGESVARMSTSTSSSNEEKNKGQAEDLYVNTQEERQAAVQQTEDLYINCSEERKALEQMEDLYINCQEERQAAIRDEDKAREDFEAVTRKLDKILMEDELSSSPTSDADQTFRVLYPYSPQNDDELAITENEILHHVSSHDHNWIKVRNTSGQEGLVPCNYISPNVSLEEKHHFRYPDTPESDEWDENSDIEEEGDVTAIEYRAIYDYVPQHDGDLALSVGDRVAAITSPGDNGWCKGYCNGNEGWFPAAYVEMATESAPSTPAALSTAPPFAAYNIDTHAPTPGSNTPSSEDRAIDISHEALSDDAPPPLPTCPPPTDEELEELEKDREESQTSPEEQLTPPASSAGAAQRPSIPPVHIYKPSSRSAEGASCHTYPNSTSGADKHSPELNTTYVVHNSKSASSSGVKIGEIPPGGYGANSKRPGSSGSYSNSSSLDDSEGERSRFKLPKKFGRPKFVKIPKRILLRRAGSVGKRPAPPPPGVHHKIIPEISAPILQQASDPTRIAASQELRVSFKEPTAASSGDKNRQTTTKTKESSRASSPGILKKGPGSLMKSPHGGSYVDILGNGHTDTNANNNLDQSSSAQSVNGFRKNDPTHSHRNSCDNDNDDSINVASLSYGPDDLAKTPPSRPRPISGLSKSAPHAGPQSRLGSDKQGPRSNTDTPVVQGSSWALRHNNRFHHSISEESAEVVNGHNGESDFSLGPQPRKGRRYNRPTGAPPPRPKMPPPPRPPGPPPGRVGAHGDGVYVPGRGKNRPQKPPQFVRLEGLDESHSCTESFSSDEPVTKQENLEPESEEEYYKCPRALSRVIPEEEEEVADSVKFPVNNARVNGQIDLNQGLPELSKASHLTESSDFDELDGPAFEVVAIHNPATNLHSGPRDSFRKYKKDKSGGKKSTLVVEIPDISHKESGKLNVDKRRSHTLPNGVSNTAAWPASKPGEMVNGGPSRVETKVSKKSSSLDRARTNESVLRRHGSWMDDPESPSKRQAPPRPPPPSVSPEKNRRNSQHRNSKGDIPVKPPRRDKIRRSIDGYQAVERGELSFDEDTLIKDVGLIPDRPGWSVGLLIDGTMGVYPTDFAHTISGMPDSEWEVEC